MNKIATSVIATIALSATAWAEPAPDLIQNLSVSQNESRLLMMSFTLTEDAIVTLDMTTNGVTIGSANFQTVFDMTSNDKKPALGKVLKQGAHNLAWQPRKEWPGYVFKDGSFAVNLRAWPLQNPPDYMVVDLQTPSNRTYYVSANDLPGGIKTADPDDTEAVNALVNDPYRTTKLVMRRVPASGNKWLMGSPTSETQWRSGTEVQHYVTLTEDFYMGIYPITCAQANRPPIEERYAVTTPWAISFGTFRGSTATDAYNWPTGREIDPDSYLGKMRALTGLALDLPTEAQREFACRAGTSGAFCDNSANGLKVGWGIDNAEGKGLLPVGLKTPNSWGLYELHGNAMEWTLDRWGTLPEDAQVNPEGPADASGSYRVLKGAHTGENLIVKGRSASRTQGNASQNYYNKGYTGVRVVCPITVPAAE